MSETKSQKFQSISTGISVLVIPLIIGYYGNKIEERIEDKKIEMQKLKLDIEKQNNEHLLSQRYITLAINVLQKEPTKNNKQLRKWAVEIINKYSKIKMNQKLQESLINTIPLSNQEKLKYELFGEYTFKWNGDPKKGYDFEVEIYDNNKWQYFGGYCLIGNQIAMKIPKNKQIRWRVHESTSKKKTEWIYINTNNYL